MRRSQLPTTTLPTTTQGGVLEDVVTETRLNPGLATWTALCVHGRTEVTWFRTQLTTSDHAECHCGADPRGGAGDPGALRVAAAS